MAETAFAIRAAQGNKCGVFTEAVYVRVRQFLQGKTQSPTDTK